MSAIGVGIRSFIVARGAVRKNLLLKLAGRFTRLLGRFLNQLAGSQHISRVNRRRFARDGFLKRLRKIIDALADQACRRFNGCRTIGDNRAAGIVASRSVSRTGCSFLLEADGDQIGHGTDEIAALSGPFPPGVAPK